MQTWVPELTPLLVELRSRQECTVRLGLGVGLVEAAYFGSKGVLVSNPLRLHESTFNGLVHIVAVG